MEICPSKYIANKLNIRSFTNIIKYNLIGSDNAEIFLRNILEREEKGEKVSVLPANIKIIINKLRCNLKDFTKHDFRNYFKRDRSSQYLSPVDKCFVVSGCLKALHEIIPYELYGSNANQKLMKKYVQTIIFTLKGEQIDLSNILQKWNYSETPWNELPEPGTILSFILIWILEKLITGIICLNFYVTTCKLNSDEYRLYFFWLSDWQRFYSHSLNRMIATNILQKYDPYCYSKKARSKLSIQQRLEVKNIKLNTPKIHFILKKNFEYRPIVKYKIDKLNNIENKKVKERLDLLKALSSGSKKRIEQEYMELYQTWIKLGKPKLYFVKTDLTNAFGSINKQNLIKILIEKHLELQKGEKSLNVKRKIAQVFKDLILELKNPLFIRAGSVIYEWKRGLVQGYKYSTALSEIYYDYLDKVNFDQLNTCKVYLRFLTRIVDDYLFITESLDCAKEFIKCLTYYKNVRYDKTEINFVFPGIKYNCNISFLGYSYNTSNLEVTRADSMFLGKMCYKISFYNTQNIQKFLESRIGPSSVQSNSHIFNFNYNSEELIWKQVFITFCISANKFCTALAILCDEKDMFNLLSLYKKKVSVKLSNTIILSLKKNQPAEFVFRYCINHFRYLSWYALSICAKKTYKCSGLVPKINDEMSKCNCIFSKWREHASRIDSDGNSSQKACKEICRRSDLRVIVKSLEAISTSFRFYKNRIKS